MKNFIFLKRVTKDGGRDVVLNLNSVSFMEPTTYENNGKVKEGTLIQLAIKDKRLYVEDKFGSIIQIIDEKRWAMMKILFGEADRGIEMIQYKLIWRNEVIDTADSKMEALTLKLEYELAFNSSSVRILKIETPQLGEK